MNRFVLAAVLAALACSCTPLTSRTQEAAASVAPAASPIPRRTGFATADDGARIYYEACGSGPAIVLVHGLGGNHAVWFRQVAHFARDHTVVTVSQRGFAPSSGDRKRYDARRLVRDLRAVLRAAGVDRAVVVGQSMGGWTALAFALEAPEMVRALVLADTTGGIHDETIASHLREVAASAARLRREPPPLGVHPALSPAFSSEHPDLGYLYQTLTTFGAPAPDDISAQLFRTRFDAGRLRELRVPTLLVVGSEDRLFPPKLVRHAASLLPVSVVTVIDGAGHSPYFERPEAWNAAVSGVLAGD